MGAGLRRPDTYTKLLIRGDGTGNAIYDLAGKTITPNNNVTQSQITRKYIGGSIVVSGNGDYVSTSDSDDWSIGSGDFSMSCWVNFTTLPTWYAILVSQYIAGTTLSFWWGFYRDTGDPAGQYRMYLQSASADYCDFYKLVPLTVSTWTHLEVDKSGSSYYVFKDGVQMGSTQTDDPMPSSTAGLYIGYHKPDGIFAYAAYIDEFRFIKGLAEHTANFTPPTRRK